MLIFWRGWGILVPVIFMGTLAASQLVIDWLMGDGFYTDSYWSKAAAGAIAAILIALVGLTMNRNRKAWSTRHSLFYLPMEYWSIVVLFIDAAISYHEYAGTNQW